MIAATKKWITTESHLDLEITPLPSMTPFRLFYFTYLAEYVWQAVYTFIPVTTGRILSVAATMGPGTTKSRLFKPVVTMYERMPSWTPHSGFGNRGSK